MSRVLEPLRAPAPQDVLASLADQERKVAVHISEGLTNRESEVRMFLAEKTVKKYVSSVLSKLGLPRRAQVAVLATGWRQPPS